MSRRARWQPPQAAGVGNYLLVCSEARGKELVGIYPFLTFMGNLGIVANAEMLSCLSQN